MYTDMFIAISSFTFCLLHRQLIVICLCSAEDRGVGHDRLQTADERRLLAVVADLLQTRLQEQQTRLCYLHSQTSHVSTVRVLLERVATNAPFEM